MIHDVGPRNSAGHRTKTTKTIRMSRLPLPEGQHRMIR
jgi:hypothetical protein